MQDRRNEKTERALVLGGALLVAALTAAHVAYYFPRVVDDLFISLRYAERFAHGHGITYNPGERVEGYSSPLWMFLQAIGFALRIEGVTWTKLLSLSSLAALQVGLYRLLRERLGAPVVAAFLPCVLVALDSYVVNWSLLGLETPLYLALLVWFPVVLGRVLDDRAAAGAPSRRRTLAAAAVTIALAATRPEAPLYVAAVAVTDLARATDRADLARRVRVGVSLAVPVLGIVVALLLARRAYFGLWFPHTYYVKGATAGYDLAKLAPLHAQGVQPLEKVLLLGGIALVSLLAIVKRAFAPFAAVVACLYFTASVELDWMPSLRHLLPVLVFGAVGWGWLVSVLASVERGRAVAWPLAGVVAAIAIAGGAQIAKVDNRWSPEENRGRNWILPKTEAKWRDTLMALRRQEPPHVKAMPPFDMGMITQNYRILEASADPLEASWYVGRDIGKVGFYTDVRVFDTPGLFTPAVVKSEHWRAHKQPDDALLAKGFEHHPIAAELYDNWAPVLARHPEVLKGYDVVVGSPSMPIDIVARDRPRPAAVELLRRYEASLAKFPRWFYLSTLYGESVGAAMEKRVRIVRASLQDELDPPVAPGPGETEGGGATLEGTIASLGCKLSKAVARPGEDLVVTCFYRAIVAPKSAWQVFLHFDDEAGNPRFKGDHVPGGGFRPTPTWRPGDLVRDVAHVTIPPDTPAGKYRLMFGLWQGDRRPKVEPVSATDGKDRIKGPIVEVRP